MRYFMGELPSILAYTNYPVLLSNTLHCPCNRGLLCPRCSFALSLIHEHVAVLLITIDG